MNGQRFPTTQTTLEESIVLLKQLMRTSTGDALKILALPNPPGKIADHVAAAIGAALRDSQNQDIVIFIYRVQEE